MRTIKNLLTCISKNNVIQSYLIPRKRINGDYKCLIPNPENNRAFGLKFDLNIKSWKIMHIEICVVFEAKIVGQRSTAISDIIFGIWYYIEALLIIFVLTITNLNNSVAGQLTVEEAKAINYNLIGITLFGGTDPFSKAIKKVTDSPYSHVGIILCDNDDIKNWYCFDFKRFSKRLAQSFLQKNERLSALSIAHTLRAIIS
jgi:hypothetical protein